MFIEDGGEASARGRRHGREGESRLLGQCPDRRQLLPYRITEGLPVTREQCRRSSVFKGPRLDHFHSAWSNS